jgi:arsenical pump membrane protein
MFVIVLALKDCGFTEKIKELLISGKKSDGVTVGLVSALASNLLNNIPMSVLFETIVSGTSRLSIYGAVVGSNIGAFITPVGALAGIMWMTILKRFNVNLSFAKFIRYGVIISMPALAAALLGLVIVF